MTPEALHLVHRLERRFETFDSVDRTQPAEVPRRDDGEKIKPDICGRCAVGENRTWFFLEIVGREHLVRAGDKSLKKAPIAPRNQPQLARVALRNRQVRRCGRRDADPPGDHRRQRPEAQKWRRERNGPGPGIGQQCPNRDRKGGASGQLAQDLSPIRPKFGCRLRGRRPLEQALAPDIETEKRAADSIRHQPRLVREKRNQKRDLRKRDQEIVAYASEVTAFGDAAAARNEAGDPRQEGGQSNGCQNEARPDFRGLKRKRPTIDQRKHGRGRHERAAQIVRHFPSTDEVDSIALATTRVASVTENPRQQLPIATYPAVLARRGDFVAGGKFLDHLDVGDEACSGEAALQEIVA